jgi:hypothetical protein
VNPCARWSGLAVPAVTERMYGLPSYKVNVSFQPRCSYEYIEHTLTALAGICL